MQILPGSCAGDASGSSGGICHQHFAQCGEGAEKVAWQLRQIINNKLKSPEKIFDYITLENI